MTSHSLIKKRLGLKQFMYLAIDGFFPKIPLAQFQKIIQSFCCRRGFGFGVGIVESFDGSRPVAD